MARTPAKVAKYTSDEFHSRGFSDLARFRALGIGPVVIQQLAAVARAHLALRSPFSRADDRTQSELRAIRKALDRLLDRVDTLSPSTKKYLQGHPGSLLGILGWPTLMDDLEAIQGRATEAARRIQSTVRSMKKPVGGPVDRTTRDLAVRVAIVLRRDGIELAISRTGKFAQVLEEILFELYRNAPQSESLMPYLQFAVRHLKDTTDPTLGQLFDLAVRPGVAMVDAIWYLPFPPSTPRGRAESDDRLVH